MILLISNWEAYALRVVLQWVSFHSLPVAITSNNGVIEIESNPILARGGLRGRKYYVSIADTRHICVNPSQTRATAT